MLESSPCGFRVVTVRIQGASVRIQVVTVRIAGVIVRIPSPLGHAQDKGGHAQSSENPPSSTLCYPARMLFTPVQVLLRDGRPCTIRQATMDDAPALFALERAIVRTRQGVVKHEDELPSEVTVYADRLRPRLSPTDGMALTLLIEMQGTIVGEAAIERIGLRMLRHVGIVSLGVHPAAWGLGLGRALLERLIEWARTHRDADGGRVLRVELYTRADNARATALYRSLGFTTEGVRRGFVRRDDGTLVDDLVMGLLLDALDAVDLA